MGQVEKIVRCVWHCELLESGEDRKESRARCEESWHDDGHVVITIVVMVWLVRPVHQRMCRLFGLGEGNRLTRNHTHLPEGKCEDDENGEPTEHARSLASEILLTAAPLQFARIRLHQI